MYVEHQYSGRSLQSLYIAPEKSRGHIEIGYFPTFQENNGEIENTSPE